MHVCWATKLRGFLKHISEFADDVQFIQTVQYYEISSKFSTLKSNLIRSRFFDILGLYQTVSISGKKCDAYASYNRFLNADRPYFIYLENPTALYHYALGRIKTPMGKKRFKKSIEDPNLKYIVCMSEACRSTFEKVNMLLPANLKMKTIYPLVPQNKYITEEVIRKKSYSDVLECLYCAQGKRFVTKGGEDVIEAVIRLQDKG